MALTNKIVAINDNIDIKEDKLRSLYELHKDEWPDNALEGGVFQIYKRHIDNEERLTKVNKPHIINT